MLAYYPKYWLNLILRNLLENILMLKSYITLFDIAFVI